MAKASKVQNSAVDAYRLSKLSSVYLHRRRAPRPISYISIVLTFNMYKSNILARCWLGRHRLILLPYFSGGQNDAQIYTKVRLSGIV